MTSPTSHDHRHGTCCDHAPPKSSPATSKTQEKPKHAHTHDHHSKNQIFMNVMEKASAIGLGIFAAYTNMNLFLPSFAFGVTLGIYSFFDAKNNCDEGHSVSGCSHDLLESITKVKLPRIILLIASVATLVCHIDHHESVFVPIVGIFIGAWVGKMVSEGGSSLYRKYSVQSSKGLSTCAA